MGKIYSKVCMNTYNNIGNNIYSNIEQSVRLIF